MGEKGNVTSEELVGATTGLGAVVAGAGTQVTAVFEEAAGSVKDKVFDKGADAGLGVAAEKWKQRHADDSDGATGTSTPG